MDLPLYKINTATVSGSTTDTLTAIGLTSAVANGVEVLAGKVVKYLLTIKGTDALNPEYGSTLMQYTQIAKNQLPRLQIELISALSTCTTFIKAAESITMADSMRLGSIQLQNLTYNSGSLRDQVDIYIKITSLTGENALLDIPIG